MAQQRTWRQRHQDAYQLQQLRASFAALRKEKENATWQRHHETAWIASAESRYQAARSNWDATVESWLTYCRHSGCDGNVMEIYHP